MDTEIELSLNTIITLFMSAKSAVDYAYDDSPNASAQKQNLSSDSFFDLLVYECYTHIESLSPEEYNRLVEIVLDFNVKLNAIGISRSHGVIGKKTVNDS